MPYQLYLHGSFNRNIVECKVQAAADATKEAQVLIETLWNVKLTIHMTQKALEKVLIETLWNVKAIVKHLNICTILF